MTNLSLLIRAPLILWWKIKMSNNKNEICKTCLRNIGNAYFKFKMMIPRLEFLKINDDKTYRSLNTDWFILCVSFDVLPAAGLMWGYVIVQQFRADLYLSMARNHTQTPAYSAPLLQIWRLCVILNRWEACLYFNWSQCLILIWMCTQLELVLSFNEKRVSWCAK